jgi:hypothetical protein
MLQCTAMHMFGCRLLTAAVLRIPVLRRCIRILAGPVAGPLRCLSVNAQQYVRCIMQNVNIVAANLSNLACLAVCKFLQA